VIFDGNYDFINMRGYSRFTPKAEDIIKIEYILNSKLKQVTDKNDQDSIYINLKYYMRQYIGLINAKGEKVVFVNFLRGEYIKDMEELAVSEPKLKYESWKESWKVVSDGGNYFWKIKINIKRKYLFDFAVNGES
jgi:hypothetical protein